MPRTPFTRGLAGVLVAALAVGGMLLLEPVPVYSHTPISTNITFKKEISQIFQRSCMRCHAEGNIAMSFTTYTDARPWAVAIKEEILEHRMPPWNAVNGYGHFANDGSLTSREVAVIVGWVTGGAPSGVLKAEESDPPVMVPALTGWEAGEPDQTIALGKDFTVTPDSGTSTHRFEVATGFTSPKWLRGLQFDPEDRRVVQWASVSEAGTGRWLGGWTPLSITSQLPDGAAFRLPANARLIVEVGYKAAGEPVKADAELGLYFSASNPHNVANSMSFAATPVDIAAGATNQRLRFEKVLPESMDASAIFPTLGAGGKSVEVMAIRPNGSVEPMLWVDGYRGDWRSPYIFRDPVPLPQGTRLIVTAYYDNTGDAPLKAQADLAVTGWKTAPPAATPGR